MGYYTSYSLSSYGDENDIKAFENDLLEISKDDGNIDVEVDELIKYGGVNAKLYDLDSWISEIAPKYPDLLIVLSGDGEYSDDNWEQRWKGTETELQKAIIPPFKNQNLWTDSEKKNNNNN